MLGIMSLEESEYLHTIWSNIIDEYQKYMAEFNRLGKNYNSCFKFFKEIVSRALALSMRSNHDCLNVHRTNYTNTVTSKIRVSINYFLKINLFFLRNKFIFSLLSWKQCFHIVIHIIQPEKF